MKQSKELQELREILIALENDHVSKVLDTLIKFEGELSATDVQTAPIDNAFGVFCKLFTAVIPKKQYRPELLADILTLLESKVAASYKFCEDNKPNHFKLCRGRKDERN